MNNLSELFAAMGTHSLAELPREACGIITKDLRYVPCRNISKTPKTSFVVDPIEIYNNGDNILGFFHSHPGSSDPIPSSRDAQSALFSEYMFIVGFGTKFYRYWIEENKLRFEPVNESNFKIPSTAS